MTNPSRYASVADPLIAAVVEELFRFKTEAQAIARLDVIRKKFILSKQTGVLPPACALWVKGYAVTEEERAAGYSGHFMLISLKPREPSGYTLAAMKLAVELKSHPERRREKRAHPDWGHPILRAVKKEKSYATEQEAFAELMELHEEYPEISTPMPGKLLIMIYGKAGAGGLPVKKYQLEVRQVENGYHLQAQEQKKRAAPKKAAQEDIKGKFTAMAQMRKRKPKPGT